MATYHVLAASLLFLSLMGPGATVEVNPVSKVLDLLGSLEAKITAEGEAEANAYKEFAEWCDDSKMEAGFAIKTATKEIAEENAAIAKATSDGSAADEEIESLVGSIATGESELKDATTVRDKEHADFVAAEADLVDTVDTLDRAVVIISREMAKNPALLQKKVDSSNMQSVLQTLSILIDAASLTGADGKKNLLPLCRTNRAMRTLMKIWVHLRQLSIRATVRQSSTSLRISRTKPRSSLLMFGRPNRTARTIFPC